MGSDGLSRKDFLKAAFVAAATSALPHGLSAQASPQEEIGLDDLKAFEKVAGIQFTEDERKQVLNSVKDARNGFVNVRKLPIDYTTLPPTPFYPEPVIQSSAEVRTQLRPLQGLKRPASDDDLAYSSVRTLALLLRSKKLSPVELTMMYLDRYRKYGEKLLCLVTLCEDLAMKQAKQAEQEIMSGKYRGPLHGVPYGIKDLFAVNGYPCTWGAQPYRRQKFDYDAGVVERLNQAGAICLAKTSLGALAQGDMWFAGRTKNPWNPAQGSSGSSAGSACSAAAGLAAFTIGTETLGSIVSPSFQCRVTGLRPTFGRVSRFGAMAVSWTMDKVGPICRSAEDCALVLGSIVGADPRDECTVNRSYHWPPKIDIKKLRIGYLLNANDDPKDRSRIDRDPALKMLGEMGAQLDPIRFDPLQDGVDVILGVEAAAAFDAFTLSDQIDELKNSAWPNTYRSNRYVPAVEYLQAQRARRLMMRAFAKTFEDFDLFVASGTGAYSLFLTNLTGHPQVLIPLPPSEAGQARAFSLVGHLYDEERILAVAQMLQDRLDTGYSKHRPDLSKL